jgi:hypothetical protein
MSVVSTGYIIIKTQQFSCFSFHLWAFPFKFGNYLDIIMMNGRQSMCVRYQVIFFFCCSNDIHRETISLRNYQWMWYNCLSSIKKTLFERQLILKEEQQHLVYNATVNKISAISSWSVLLVEETGVHWENHGPVASHGQTLSHNVVSSIPQLSGIRTHNLSGDRYWWLHR